MWLDDLDYYVAEQGIRLPDAFVAAIQGWDYSPPTDLDVDPQDLPSPPVVKGVSLTVERYCVVGYARVQLQGNHIRAPRIARRKP